MKEGANFSVNIEVGLEEINKATQSANFPVFLLSLVNSIKGVVDQYVRLAQKPQEQANALAT